MKRDFCFFLALLLSFVLSRPVYPQEKPFPFTADELGKLAVVNEKEFLTYKGKTLIITGTIDSLKEPYIFLKTNTDYKTGQPVKICIRMLDFRSNKAKEGELVTIGGELEFDGVFGPTIKNGRLPLLSKK